MTLKWNTRMVALEADVAIRNALALYCRAMDRMDDELALGLFDRGATVSYTPDMFVGTAVEFVPWVHAVHEGFTGTVHRMATPYVRVDARRGLAISEAAGHIMLFAAEAPVRHAFGRYVDRWRRTPQGWRITARDYRRDAQIVGGVAGASGDRGRADFSYDVFAGFDSSS